MRSVGRFTCVTATPRVTGSRLSRALTSAASSVRGALRGPPALVRSIRRRNPLNPRLHLAALRIESVAGDRLGVVTKGAHEALECRSSVVLRRELVVDPAIGPLHPVPQL